MENNSLKAGILFIPFLNIYVYKLQKQTAFYHNKNNYIYTIHKKNLLKHNIYSIPYKLTIV